MLFGGMVFIMRYGCVIWGYGLHYEVWLCYLGYGLHYEVWLCYLGVWSSL